MGRSKGFKKDAGTQCTRVIMHIVTFFSFAGGTIAFFFFFRLLGLFIMLLLVFLSWPEEGERGKDGFRWREGREFVIGFVDLEGLRELGDFEGCKK